MVVLGLGVFKCIPTDVVWIILRMVIDEEGSSYRTGLTRDFSQGRCGFKCVSESPMDVLSWCFNKMMNRLSFSKYFRNLLRTKCMFWRYQVKNSPTPVLLLLWDFDKTVNFSFYDGKFDFEEL